MKQYMFELIGTFFFVLVIELTKNPIAIAAILCALVYGGSKVSGGVYNPAIAFSAWIVRNLKLKDLIFYSLFELIGATLATFLANAINGKPFVIQTNTNVLLIILIEVIFTFLFVYIVLEITTPEKNKGNQYFGIAIALALYASIIAGGSISGGVYNPAIALGASIGSHTSFANFLQMGIYSLSELTGGAIAGVLYYTTNPDKK